MDAVEDYDRQRGKTWKGELSEWVKSVRSLIQIIIKKNSMETLLYTILPDDT
jgi:hypothetical protein